MKQIIPHFFIAIFFLLSYKTFGSSEYEDPPSAERSKSFQCLIVDDAALNRKFLGRMIQNATRDLGEVILNYAENEEKAAAILAESPSIHLMISDGNMTSDIGGTKLVADIRSTFKGFIVAWSTDPTEVAGMLAAGANYALSKPASSADVKDMILKFYERL